MNTAKAPKSVLQCGMKLLPKNLLQLLKGHYFIKQYAYAQLGPTVDQQGKKYSSKTKITDAAYLFNMRNEPPILISWQIRIYCRKLSRIGIRGNTYVGIIDIKTEIKNLMQVYL
jgi:hypothetical protein